MNEIEFLSTPKGIELYDQVCRVLTDYEENPNTEEVMTDLYDTLVEVQRAMADFIN